MAHRMVHQVVQSFHKFPAPSSLSPVPCPKFPVPLRSLWLKLFRFKLIEGDEQVVQGFLSKRTRGRNLFLGKPYLPINHVHVYFPVQVVRKLVELSCPAT